MKPKIANSFLYFALATILIAFLVRVYHFGERSLWLDEAIAANISRGTFADTVALTRVLHSAPLIHPIILWVVERFSSEPYAVRLPSLVFSLLAVCTMFFFARIPGISQKTAGISALLMGISATQIRYGQEVREYSLSIFVAALLTYLVLSLASDINSRRYAIALCVALFTAPLVQYGLVLFSAAVLVAFLVFLLSTSSLRNKFLQLTTAAVALAAGSILSFLLTLRYQWGDNSWYLEGNFLSSWASLPHFVSSATYERLNFLLPGRLVALISAVAMTLYLIHLFRARVISPLLILTVSSLLTVLICAVFRRYPYGGIRQCLFLAPVICLGAAVSLVYCVDTFAKSFSRIGLGFLACLITVAGALQIRSIAPYAEIEDTRSILQPLQADVRPEDGVYVYSGAVPAIDFYFKGRNPQFLYGDFHREAPEKYSTEFQAGISPGASRTWIVFSHVYQEEDRIILSALSTDWNLRPIILSKGASLYLAQRRLIPDNLVSSALNSNSVGIVATRGSRDGQDGFKDWSMRNSARRTP